MVNALKSRLDRHFVACSAAAAAASVGGVAQQNAEAAIVYTGTPLVIPGTFAGVYLNVFTGFSAGAPNPGWDLNPYEGGNRLFQALGAGWVASGGIASNLIAGTMIDGTSTFAAGNGSPTMTGNFISGTPGIIGFRFAEGGFTYYGWARLNKGANATTAGSFVDYAWENTPNTGIAAGAIPTPGSLALLALGAAGLVGRRRK